MTNLIPPDAHRLVKREYWVRVFIVWMMLIGSAALTVIILTVPVFVLIKNQLASYQNQFVQASEERTSFAVLEGIIEKTMNMTKVILSIQTQKHFTDIIEQIESIAGEGIVLQKFELQRDEVEVHTIVVSGVASSRLVLASFVERLKATPEFSQAELPLSNLAKDKDIPFTITVVKPKEESKEKKKK